VVTIAAVLWQLNPTTRRNN